MAQLAVIVMCRSERPPPDVTRSLASSATKRETTQKAAYVPRYISRQFAQSVVAAKIANHHFTIKTEKPNVEVSWQVTGIRHDAWANAHRIPAEKSKPEGERGFYQHPELFQCARGESPRREALSHRSEG